MPTIIIISLLVWFIFTFLVYPNFNLLKITFFSSGEFSFEPFQKLLSSDRALKSLFNSFLLAITLVITVNIVGIFLVLVTNYFDIKGAKILRLGYYTTVIYSGIVLVAGYKFIYGDSGIITNALTNIFPSFDPGWFEGYGAVVFVMTFSVTTNHMIFLTNAIKKIDFQTIEAAKNMGASNFYTLRRVVFPTLKPTLFAITILIFITGLNAFSAPLIVGGRDFQTISPMILSFAKSPTSRDIAAILGIVLGLATIILLTWLLRLEKGGNYISVSKVSTEIKKQKINNKFANVLMHTFAYILFAIYTLPVILIVIFSFTDSYSIATSTISLKSFSLENYKMIFTQASAYKPYLVSIFYSLLAAIIVVVLVLIVSRILHRYENKYTMVLEYSLHIPWFLPSVLIALGLILTFDSPSILIGNNVLTGTIWGLLFAYVIVQIPFTLRMLKASFFSIDSSLEEASKNLGASTFYTFRRILFPIILPSALAILVINFNTQLADYDLTVFLYHPIFQPLGIVIKNSTDAQATSDSQALTFVYSVILMIISAVAFYIGYGRKSKS